MSRSRPFAQVDVFATGPFLGNPVAVVPDAADLDDERMRRLARWTNLSETTFVLPPTHPDADYRLRIFTPGGELPFAGHPTLGSAHAWLEAGGAPRDPSMLVQECGAGLVRIRRDDEGFSFAAPPTVRDGAVDEADLVRFAAALGIARGSIVDHQWIDNGPGWAILRLGSAEEVLALEPDFSRAPDLMIGAIGATQPGSEHAFEIRSFAPRIGVVEDPVCGSMNAGAGQWLRREGLVEGPYRVAQGARLGRAGSIRITPDGDDLWVGGATTTLIRGDIAL